MGLLLLAAVMLSSPSSAAEMLLRRWPDKAPAPPLSLDGLDGRAVTLASLRGKVVILNFWASWCAPCIDELPVMNDLAEGEAARGNVVVLGVNYKESATAIQRFTGEHPFRFPILMDKTGDAFQKWTGGVLPATILIDRSGRPRWQVIGELDSKDGRFIKALNGMLAP
jgi:thiol-disulfide isomerase/thioredoxin